MSDWIDKLKLEKEREANDATEKEKAKQQRREAIRARLPFFIARVAEKVRSDVEKLSAAFPNDARYHLAFQEELPGFKLTNRNSPLFDVEFRLILDPSQTVVRTAVAKLMPHNSPQFIETELPTALDDNDRLSVEFGGKRHFRPEDLGEEITKFVLGKP